MKKRLCALCLVLCLAAALLTFSGCARGKAAVLSGEWVMVADDGKTEDDYGFVFYSDGSGVCRLGSKPGNAMQWTVVNDSVLKIGETERPYNVLTYDIVSVQFGDMKLQKDGSDDIIHYIKK